MRQAEGPEHVEPDDGPAESAQMVVDLEQQAAIAPPPLGCAGPIAAAPALPVSAIEDDVHGGVAGKRTLRVLVELLAVTRDDQDLLGDLPVGVLAVLRPFRPALGKGMELRQHLERALIEELRQKHPGISATRGARRGSDFKACLAIEAQRQAAKRQMR